jgi:ABC-type antimicrobial peptide transport system permease subunit
VVLVAAAGCAIGVMLSYPLLALIAPVLSAKMGMTGAGVSPTSIAMAAAAAIATGLLGALWPAMRAAGLNAVDALRTP